MAIEKNQIHTDLQQEQADLEEQERITGFPNEHDNKIDRQDGPGRDDGYVPEPTPEQGVEAENEIDRVPAGEVQEQISEKTSKDMDWER